MKVSLLYRSRQQGGILVATMIATLVLGIILVGYITMVGSANRDAVRSETWNAALVLAEAGLEEALAHLQVNYPSNMVAQGWTLEGTNVTRTRHLGDTYYTVRASLAQQPVVVSTGYAPLPGQTNFLARTVQILTLQTGVVTKAFATKLDIKLNGNNISSDSYDSTDPTASTPDGQYDPNLSRDNGDIATNLGTENAFDAGNAVIRGRISTGEEGTVDLGPNAVIGSDGWHDAGNVGAEPGWITDDSNVIMPEVTMPNMTGAFPPSGGIVGGTNYTYVLGDGNYVLDRLAGTVMVTGDAAMLVTRNVNISGNEFIRIAPGARLRLYVSASTAAIGGLGVVNDSSQPGSFIYYGLPGNRTLAIGGNGQFSGVVYAPETDLALNGTGEFYGGVVARTASMGGDYNFHFDESLGRTVDIRYIKILSWDEI